jgi:phosphate transport system substrate-binding protein
VPGAAVGGVPDLGAEPAKGFAAYATVRSSLGVPVDPAAPQPPTFTSPSILRQWIAAGSARFGFLGAGLVGGVHTVPIDGVPCSRATIGSGAYPLRRPLTFVTRGAPTGATAAFVRWVRSSSAARRVVSRLYVPAR